jgi:branched-chain amino acid transport system substrate-binding protein
MILWNESKNFGLNKLKACAAGLFLATLTSLWPAIVNAGNKPAIELGVIVAQTGKARDYGEAAIRGAQLAADEINQKGGVLGRRLELVVFDNHSSALDSKQAALDAVRRKVVGVVGAVWSTHSLAIGPVLQKNHIPMISPGSTAPEVTQNGQYLFRTCYTDDFQGKLMADFAYHDGGYRRAAVLTNFSETYSKILARYFTANFVFNGGEVVYDEGYKGTAADFKQLLTPLLSLKPDVIFIPGYSQDSGLIIKQAHNMGIRAVFMGGDAWETAIADFGGEALEGSYFSTFWHPNVPYDRNQEFLRRYKSSYGDKEISAYVPLAYDAVWLLAEAMARCKSVASEKIRDALAATHNFSGATGRYTFNAYGDPIKKGASILKFTDGKWIFYKAFEPK